MLHSCIQVTPKPQVLLQRKCMRQMRAEAALHISVYTTVQSILHQVQHVILFLSGQCILPPLCLPETI